MYRNWASRSGCRLPSTAREFPWVLNPCSCSIRSTAFLAHGCRAAVSSAAMPRTDSVVHVISDPGSPRVDASSRSRSAGINRGSRSSSFLRPPPGRRTRPGPASSPDASSAAPSATVCHDAPAACATAPTPPSPAARATAPSTSRRDRSSSLGSSSSSSGPIRPTKSVSAPISTSCHATRRKLRLKKDVSLANTKSPSGDTATSMDPGSWAPAGAASVPTSGCLLPCSSSCTLRTSAPLPSLATNR